MRALFKLLIAGGLAALLSACMPDPKMVEAGLAKAPPPQEVEGAYLATKDANIDIPALPVEEIPAQFRRQSVYFPTEEAPGTIIINPSQRVLYHVREGGKAMRYGIAVGREGISFRGTGYVGRKQEWPSWTPTANMVRTRPDLYAAYAGGLPGGLDNPLGARALYLYRGGRDTMFRVHGTIDNASIGRATSAGCIPRHRRARPPGGGGGTAGGRGRREGA